MKDNDNSHKVVFFFKCHKNVFEEAKLFEVLSSLAQVPKLFFILKKSKVSKLYIVKWYTINLLLFEKIVNLHLGTYMNT